MLPSLILSLREGLEIALIVGIVLGALRRTNRSNQSVVIWGGVLVAAVISLAAALFMQRIGASLEGKAEPIFEGITLLVAAGVLTWMIFWMQSQSRHIKGELEAGVRRATLKNGSWALFMLAFVAVLREGVELALFLTAAAMTTNSLQTIVGALLGLSLAALLGWALFASMIRLDLRRFFQVTGILLIFFAAGLVAQAVHEFNEAGWIPPLIEHVWDTNSVINESSLVGQVLKTLFGYNGNPSLTEVIAYVAYFGAIAIGLRRTASRLPATQET